MEYSELVYSIILKRVDKNICHTVLLPIITLAAIITIILIFPMPILDKLNYYMQVLLMIEFYILIINENLPAHNDESYAETLVKKTFIYTVIVTVTTLFLQLF